MSKRLKISSGFSSKNGITFYIKGITYGVKASRDEDGKIKTRRIVFAIFGAFPVSFKAGANVYFSLRFFLFATYFPPKPTLS